MTNSSILKLLKTKKDPSIPDSVSYLIFDYHIGLVKSFLLIELEFQRLIWKSQLKYLDCGKGYFVVSRNFGTYTRKTIIQDEFNKVSIRQYDCVIGFETRITQ